MAFSKYDSFNSLNDSTTEWKIRVRAQSIWKGITKKTGEFRGYNIVLFDDSSERIHAFMSALICPKFEVELCEGQIYILEDFTVKHYNGDETNRAVRNDKHIYFITDTKLRKDENNGLKLPEYSFDFYNLEDIDPMKTDNRFLTDVVAVIQDIQPIAAHNKKEGETTHVPFTITNGKTYINVTEWKEALHLTNFPATRFYLNPKHHAVKLLRQRLQEPNFYVMDIEDDDVEQCQILKVADIKKLTDDFIEKKVACQLTVKKVDERMNWYVHFCTNCDKDLKLVDEEYKCCNRSYPYPDKRFKLYTLCSDDTGTIPIIWPNDEICRLTGKIVYDVEADDDDDVDAIKFPVMLKFGVKKTFKFIISITRENVKEGSNVYTASEICGPFEISDSHSPNMSKVPMLPREKAQQQLRQQTREGHA
ncbi:hypothetical protein POM88_012330 [Heracleum sosnowskyi]|uniref:Replication protein A 70 kDa DNA-binding subunit B/D first OB fold domain-containing protein n=1 Tax=Heracleum sosnowskyi TaxID=360622 RepID=A0AAD8N1M0_9APIA|nr:hypothetical protein POM88_012330 [Heracleum sosnowskyi]